MEIIGTEEEVVILALMHYKEELQAKSEEDSEVSYRLDIIRDLLDRLL